MAVQLELTVCMDKAMQEQDEWTKTKVILSSCSLFSSYICKTPALYVDKYKRRRCSYHVHCLSTLACLVSPSSPLANYSSMCDNSNRRALLLTTAGSAHPCCVCGMGHLMQKPDVPVSVPSTPPSVLLAGVVSSLKMRFCLGIYSFWFLADSSVSLSPSCNQLL